MAIVNTFCIEILHVHWLYRTVAYMWRLTFYSAAQIRTIAASSVTHMAMSSKQEERFLLNRNTVHLNTQTVRELWNQNQPSDPLSIAALSEGNCYIPSLRFCLTLFLVMTASLPYFSYSTAILCALTDSMRVPLGSDPFLAAVHASCSCIWHKFKHCSI